MQVSSVGYLTLDADSKISSNRGEMIMDLQVLIKYLGKAIKSGDVRAMDYRANQVRRYLARHSNWAVRS